MDLDVICLEKPEGWDAELKQFKGSLFLSQTFLESIPSKSGIPVYFKILKDNKTIALLSGLSRPINHFRQLFFYAGFAGSFNDPENLKECKSALIRFARDNSIARLTFRSYDDTSFIEAQIKELIIARKRAEFVFDLTKTKDDITQGFDRDLRRVIRNSIKNKIVFKQSFSFDLFDHLINLIDRTHEIRVSKGYSGYNAFVIPFIDKNVIKNLLETRSATFFYLKEGNEILSMQFTIMSSGRAYGMLMGTSKTGYKLGAPSRLFYDIIMYLKEKDFYSYNIGGVPDGPKNLGLRNFKESMGPLIFQSREENSDFLISSLSQYNLIMQFKRKIMDMPLPYLVKKVLRKILNFLVKNPDQI